MKDFYCYYCEKELNIAPKFEIKFYAYDEATIDATYSCPSCSHVFEKWGGEAFLEGG